MKITVKRWWLAGVMALGATVAASAQNIEIVPIRGHMYMLAGAGANITLSVGPDGVFMVDGGSPQMTDKVIAAVKQLSIDLAKEGQPLRSYPPPQADSLSREYHDFSRAHGWKCEDRRSRQDFHGRQCRRRSEQRACQ